MRQRRHMSLIAGVACLACSPAFAADDFREAMGQDCGGDDPRSQAVCDCIFDQMETSLSEEQLEQIVEMQQRQEASEGDPEMDSDSMQALMIIAARLEEIDFMQCAAAAQP